MKSLTYLRHKISEGNIEAEDSKIKVIHEWPTPKTVNEARSFLGFTNYYHWFICKYAQVTWPLYKPIWGENPSKKNKVITWDGESEEAFKKKLKEICTSTHLVLVKGVLYRWVTPSKEDWNALQVVISQSYQKKALQGCQDDIRHMS